MTGPRLSEVRLSHGLLLGGGLAGSSREKGQCGSCLPRRSEAASSGLADRWPAWAQLSGSTTGPQALAPSSSLLPWGAKPVAGRAGQDFLLPKPLPPPADDTFAFWRGLKDAGLLDEVIQEFHQELVETMKGLQQRVQDPPLQLRGEGALGAPSAVAGPGCLAASGPEGAACSPWLRAEPRSRRPSRAAGWAPAARRSWCGAGPARPGLAVLTTVSPPRRHPAQQRRAELRHAGPGEEGAGQPQVPDGPLAGAVRPRPGRCVGPRARSRSEGGSLRPAGQSLGRGGTAACPACL